ncbi:hypothetical protein A4X13_0g5102 [Tilletia indica]|uniref:Uncharacterized protein n=1 Tax=Tilletia indica TaxID=43049 RepID=A0A177T6M7_9BASI|nr:hypothetical protein A4X13_0g5102 [Tilletia indica]
MPATASVGVLLPPIGDTSGQLSADAFMGAGRDDSKSISDEHLKSCRTGYRLDHELDALANCPEAIQKLFMELQNLTETCGRTIRTGLEAVLSILKASESTSLLRKEGRWFAERMLALLIQVANEDKAAGACDLPGRLSDLWLRGLIHDTARFHYLVFSHKLDSTVERSRSRRRRQREAAMLIQQQKDSILAFKRHFGLNVTVRNLASAPSSEKNVSAASISTIQTMFDRELAEVQERVLHQQERLLASFPDTELLLDLSAFFQAIDYATTQVDHSRSRKRARNSSKLATDQGAAVATTAPSWNHSSIQTKVRSELENDGIRFKDLQQLEAFNDRTRIELQATETVSGSQLGTFSAEDAPLFLQRLCIFSARAALFDQSVFFGELMLVLYREAESREPSLKKKIILANAHGSLSVLLRATSHKFEAVRAAEAGIEILQPFLKSNPELCSGPMAALKTMNAKALVQLRVYDTESQVSILQKAYRTFGEAIGIFQQLAVKAATNLTVKRSLADALLAQASASKLMIQEMLKYQNTLQFECFRFFDGQPRAEQNRFGCGYCEGCEPPDLVHDLIKSFGVNIVKAFVTTVEQSIEVFRVLVARVPHLYEPTLAKSLFLKAELIGMYSSRAADEFAEPVALLQNLSKKFPRYFTSASERAYVGLAQQQRREADLEGAATSYQSALQHLSTLIDQSRDSKASSQRMEYVNRAYKAQIDRTLLCIQLELYDQGWIDANRVLMLLNEEGKGSISMRFLGSVAMRGCCRWLSGHLEDAFDDTEKCFQAIKVEEQDAEGAIEEYGDGAFKFDIAEEKFEYCLAIGWYGAIQSRRGKQEAALECGERAVRALRIRLSDRGAQLPAEFGFDPIRQSLPHFLVLVAGTLLCMGRSEAAWRQVEESLKLNHDARIDGSTVKTALLLKARLLEEKAGPGDFAEAAKVRDEADKIPFQGFLHRMGCSLGRTQRRNSWSA